MDSINNLYDRQSGVESQADVSTIVIGLGGLGSWIALDLALIGVGTLILVDPDKLEASNLNRTLFKYSQIGQLKTQAIKELILERRPDTIVVTIEDYFNTDILNKYSVDYIFDATDNLSTRQMILEYNQYQKQNLIPDFIPVPYCKCGYDGFFATLSMNDYSSGRWGDEGSYTVVPSFFGTPQILSAIAVIEMLLNYSAQEYSYNFNVKKLLNKISEQL
ncbi:MAG: ThiF family adenylyltransferase [Bacteroidetes bacterium]|nr:ThiF family adenylyltransferase [Bacteroidota bacterium]